MIRPTDNEILERIAGNHFLRRLFDTAGIESEEVGRGPNGGMLLTEAGLDKLCACSTACDYASAQEVIDTLKRRAYKPTEADRAVLDIFGVLHAYPGSIAELCDIAATGISLALASRGIGAREATAEMSAAMVRNGARVEQSN